MNTNKKLLIISPNEEREGTKIKTCNLTCLHLISLYIYILYICLLTSMFSIIL